jgi:hypothetical protein
VKFKPVKLFKGYFFRLKMRRRALSQEGCRLFASGLLPPSGRSLLCGLFSSDYDDRLNSVLNSCRTSTQVLCTYAHHPDFQQHLETGLLQTLRLLLSQQGGKSNKKQIEKNYRFFLDIMNQALQSEDHQTASLMYTTLTHPRIRQLQLKTPKRNQKQLLQVEARHGGASQGFQRHIQEFKHSRGANYLPSLIAIESWTKMRRQRGESTAELDNMMEIYQYLFRGELMPLYQDLYKT